MGRLFWKIFLTLFLAQITSVAVVSLLIWRAMPEHGAFPPPPPPSVAGRMPQDAPPPDIPAIPRRDLPLLPVGVGLLASLIFALLLARHLSRPIVVLRSAFDEVARGNFDVRLADDVARRQDELADLGRHFERTARQLKQLMSSQRRLLHDVSHEVRSPLARMQIAIDLARQQPELFQTSVERIERESARINRLMEELLTLARLEAGAYGEMKDMVDLNELLEEIVADARFEAQARGCRVELESDGYVTVHGRADLLFRALENIVRNAIRHTFDSTAVRLGLAKLGDTVRLRVEDDGPGMPDAAIETMFEPFVRYGDKRQDEGYGLGLAIAREVVERHGGRIQAYNRESGGLCIEISLPRPGTAKTGPV